VNFSDHVINGRMTSNVFFDVFIHVFEGESVCRVLIKRIIEHVMVFSFVYNQHKSDGKMQRGSCQTRMQ